MTNSQSVEEDGIVAGNIFAMLDNANLWKRCTWLHHYWHTSEVINEFRLHRWRWPSADWCGCYNKGKCHWILSVYLCGIGISLKWPYVHVHVCLCP